MKNLGNIVKGIGKAVGATVATFMIAYTTPSCTGWDILGAFSNNVRNDSNSTQSQREAAAELEKIANEQSRRQHEREIAERSRTQININIEQKKETRIEQREYERREEFSNGITKAFACNYSKDFNGDGRLTYPEEFFGIKSVFHDDESLKTVFYDHRAKEGQEWLMAVVNKEGNVIRDAKEIIKHDGIIKSMKYDYAYELGGNGTFKFVYFLDKKLVCSNEIQIVEAPNAKILDFYPMCDGLQRKIVNLNEEGVYTKFRANKEGKIIIRSWDQNWKLLGEGKFDYSKFSHFVNLYAGGKDYVLPPKEKRDAMDAIYAAGSGRYNLTVDFEHEKGIEKASTDVLIVR